MPFLGKLVGFEGDRKGDPGYFAPQNSGMTGNDGGTTGYNILGLNGRQGRVQNSWVMG